MAFRLSTEALASGSARHPWLVIGGWALALVASVVLIASLLGDGLTTEIALAGSPESVRADKIAERVRGPRQANEIIIVRSAALTVDDPDFQSFVEKLYGDVIAVGSDIVAGGTNYYQAGDESLVSKDRHTTILPLVMAGEQVDADDNISEVLVVVDAAKKNAGELEVLISGAATLNHDSREVSEKDLQTGEAIGVPLALIVLVLVFGAFTAALVPLVLGILSIVVALGLTALLGQQYELAFPVTNIISMLGLAVGIDYSLFVVSRYREERARGLDKYDSIVTSGATAGRAVFFSGLTVALSLIGMLIVPTTIFRSLAAGGMIVLGVSVLASLTLLPAILGLIGDRVNALRVPIIGRGLEHADPEHVGGFWDRATRTVMRYPVISLLAVVAVMIALAVPYLDIKTGSAGVSTLPDGIESKEGFLILEKEFSFGLVTPAEIAIVGDVRGSEVESAIEKLETALATDRSYSPGRLQVNEGGDAGLYVVPVHGDPTTEEAISAIERLREQYIPAAFSGVEAEVHVGGMTAGNMDYINITTDYTPIVLAFVLGLSFILLTVVFRSLIVPLKAMVMNLLSVGAAYGLLVLIFQKGVGNEIFGFQQVDTIESWVPLWLFSILFGLSMDYHVFLLSRIRERFDRTRDNTESVAFGVRSTAAIITGAALIMAGVFGGIAAGDLVMFQQMGFGVAVAVLMDATIVRSVLVPAAMQLLGDRNWYLPSALKWLPQMRTEGPERVERASTGAEAG